MMLCTICVSIYLLLFALKADESFYKQVLIYCAIIIPSIYIIYFLVIYLSERYRWAKKLYKKIKKNKLLNKIIKWWKFKRARKKLKK